MSIEQLETAIANLPPHEFARLASWFAELEAERWDRQIEEDQRAGRFDHVIQRERRHRDWPIQTAVTHFATPEFWFHYRRLPKEVRDLADKSFQLLQADARHPSLHFKKIGLLWTARVGLHYRALALDDADGVHWFWIGTHAEYDQLLRA